MTIHLTATHCNTLQHAFTCVTIRAHFITIHLQTFFKHNLIEEARRFEFLGQLRKDSDDRLRCGALFGLSNVVMCDVTYSYVM